MRPDSGDDGLAHLDAEDHKLITLARAARGRIGAAEGAAVRDGDGRSYAAPSVRLPSVSVSALQLAVANAVAAGAEALEAAVVVTEGRPDEVSLAAVRDVSSDAPVHVVASDGALKKTLP